jgi:hypothetical protein
MTESDLTHFAEQKKRAQLVRYNRVSERHEVTREDARFCAGIMADVTADKGADGKPLYSNEQARKAEAQRREEASEDLAKLRAKASHRDRVLSMWEWLAKGGLTPCSTKTAAALVTEMLGENYFSAGQTNYDVIRKRTADLMAEHPCSLRLIEGRTDADGVARDQYEVAG